ncbi:MAG: B12-binding domain-containing radical SAM protein [Anaerolineae bacterium]
MIVGDDTSSLDVLLVNPPAPDGGPWSGGSPGNDHRPPGPQTWPPVALAQMVAMLAPDYRVAVVDAAAEGLSWAEFEAMLRTRQPRYYLTRVRPASVQNDLFGTFLARGLGARTIAAGLYASTMANSLLDCYPTLDFIVRDEPELTLRELVDTLEAAAGRWSADRAEPATWTGLRELFRATGPDWRPAWSFAGGLDRQLAQVRGLTWRCHGESRSNPDRPPIPNPDDLPLAHHHHLPLHRYQMPLNNGPYARVVVSRRSPVRARAPESVMAELWLLYDLDIHQAHLLGDGFTTDRERMMSLCRMIIEEELPLRWMCCGRVEAVDAELLKTMSRAGCCLIAWNLEPAAGPGRNRRSLDRAGQAIKWARQAGLKNWGCFPIGLPGETAAAVRETIALAKALPLDLALFHPPARGPSPRFRREGAQPTGGANGQLSAEDLAYWQKRAFREWALRPGPMWALLKDFNNWARLRNAGGVGQPSMGWVTGG